MLFNSYAFIFIFLPVVIFGFYLLGRIRYEWSIIFLFVASLFFYGYWDLRYVGLLIFSIVLNYIIAILILSSNKKINNFRNHLLITGITVNLAILAYFKYTNFFIDNLNIITDTNIILETIILPLGVSFYSFTQIAFLVDIYKGKVKELKFIQYALFVTYFPHLIAGPVIHHAEMIPQFTRQSVCRVNWDNIAIGLSIFVLGLTKKVLLADTVAEFSSPVFDAVKGGGQPMLIEAWVGAIAYTLQLYFDFSAYSDMAIGLSLMFNVLLPLNFNSPYKSTNIIDFWRSWHMTLSRFLRDYLYIPLGGSRGNMRQHYVNIAITMLIGGLWHGAAWTFVIWGGLHGSFLLVNHSWRKVKQYFNWRNSDSRTTKLASTTLTFLAVVVGWVFFRSDSYSSAIIILQGMAGLNGISVPASFENKLNTYIFNNSWVHYNGNFPLTLYNNINVSLTLLIALFIVFFTPNTSQILYQDRFSDVFNVEKKSNYNYDKKIIKKYFFKGLIVWQPSKLWAFLLSMIFIYSVTNLTKVSEFLYFQF